MGTVSITVLQVPAADSAVATNFATLPPPVVMTAQQDHQKMLELLQITSILRGRDGSNRQSTNYANYDEAQANPFPNLPDPLVLKNGQKVVTAEMWWRQRRPEIVEDFDREIYGRIPRGTPRVVWEVTSMVAGTNGDIPIITKQLVGHVDNSSYPVINVNIAVALTTPANAAGPVPVIMQFGFVMNGTNGFGRGAFGGTNGFGGTNAAGRGRGVGGPSGVDTGPTWQQQVLAKGWGYAVLSPNSVQADNGAGLTQGIIGLMNKGQPRKVDDWGALRAWAWGASRVLDYFETDKAVDARQVGLEGHSRYGKATLVAMAYDQRFAIAYVSSSGEGGAKLHRRNWGEIVENVAGSGEYHWMAGNFIKYAGPLNWGDLPVDSHELVALCAPRPVFLGAGATNGDGWADAKGTFMAGMGAGPVYALLGKKPMSITEFPPIETMVEGDVAFRQHGGGHTDGPNWPVFLKFAEKYFKVQLFQNQPGQSSIRFMNIKTCWRKSIAMCVLISSGIVTASPQANPLGQFEGSSDIGSPKLAGTASYDAANQEYTISGAGTNMWFGGDQFHFVWKKLKGDFILRTRVEFVGKGAVEHRKAGWMVRPSLDLGAPYADCAEHGDGLTSLQFRRSKGTNTEQMILSITNADMLQFERKGSTFVFSAARQGEPFVRSQPLDLDLDDEVFAGLFVCSHTADVIEKAIFRDVRIIRPVKEGFVPYRDYIGSLLEILDVHSGKLETIYNSQQPFEAPNWTKDGSALIYNTSGRSEGWGRLCRFDLTTRQAAVISTGSAIRNNNDHVLSFDGTMLGISDQSLPGGQSTVFTLPVGGGTPKRITSLSPSYLHGWSSDGKFLVYTGGRSNKFDIYKISSDGSGTEIRLTDSEGLNDGPEFTPDGKYIYFNSSRTGRMQIWRMKPDGKDQEQVTDDEFNNWFPHISPDGKWIAFLSFPKEVSPTDHPYYKQVYLRLLPMEGGKPKVIAYIYGGQGTINVPSWSPDSKRLAFVSNSDAEK